MKISLLSKWTISLLIMTSLVIGCKDRSGPSGANENQINSESNDVETRLDLALMDVKQDKFDTSSFVLKGLYGDKCFGRKKDELWTLSADKTKKSSLVVKQNNAECKLTVTGFEFYKGTDKAKIEYKLEPTAYELKDIASKNNLEFNLITNSKDALPKFYSKIKINPADFKTNPVITIVLTEFNKNIDIDMFSTQFSDSKIFTPEIDPNDPSKNIKFIAASDYTFQKVTGNSEKDFKVFYDKDNQRVLYHGSLKFTATKVAKSYLVVNGSELVKADYKEIDDLFKGEKNKSKINVIASGNEVVIDANTLRIDGDLSEVLAVNTTETVKIIFMNSDEENTLNSYQVISFNIINKTSN